MAIQTIKATIQMRKGAEQNFDPSQMTAGEWAVSTDSKKVWMCFAPGIVRRMATYEAFEQDMVDMQTILATCRDIQAAVERFEQLAEQHASQAETWSITSKSWAIGGTGTREGEDADNSKYYSERSKSEADRAKNEADRAAAIAGIDIDSELSETSANPVQNKVIAKVLAKLKEVAFSGSYTDLSNKPSIPSITNNYLATQPGTAADAMLAKELRGDIDAINSKLTVKSKAFTSSYITSGVIVKVRSGIAYVNMNVPLVSTLSNNDVLATINDSNYQGNAWVIGILEYDGQTNVVQYDANNHTLKFIGTQIPAGAWVTIILMYFTKM